MRWDQIWEQSCYAFGRRKAQGMIHVGIPVAIVTITVTIVICTSCVYSSEFHLPISFCFARDNIPSILLSVRIGILLYMYM